MKITPLIVSVFATGLALTSSAKDINLKIPVEQHENIQIIAKHGVFSVFGWNENFVNLEGKASEDVAVERGVAELLLTLNAGESAEVQDELIIRVPANMEIGVTSNDADFSFDGLNADLSGSTESGDFQVINFSARLSLKSLNGNVDVRNSSGEFSINTVNGDIAIVDSRGVANIRSVAGNQNIEADLRNLSSSNVSGQSLLKLRTIEKLKLNNVSGNSYVESAVSDGATIQMQSAKGNLSLLVPKTTSARFSLQSHQGGSIHNGLGGEPDAANSDEDTRIFTLSDASASVTMNTMEGSIEVGELNELPTEGGDGAFDWSSVDRSILDMAYINPNMHIRDFKHFFIKDPEITFDPRWVQKYGDGKTRAYRQRIAKSYGKLLKSAIAKRFSRDTHLKLSKDRGEDILVVIPKVVELYIDTPDTAQIVDLLVTTPAGKAKIDLALYSPKDKSVLALFIDTRHTEKPENVMPIKPRTMNRRAFSRLFNFWIEGMVKLLTL